MLTSVRLPGVLPLLPHSTPRRIRYLRPDDWPLLLRLRDVDQKDEQCHAALAAYACTERKGVRPAGYSCADDPAAAQSERRPSAAGSLDS